MTRVATAVIVCLLCAPAAVAEPDPNDWDAVLARAYGQTVYWHAWAGFPRANAYIAWASRQVAEQFGVTVEHVKLSDTAEAVSRVVAEKAAGHDHGGAVDLIWINGENFQALKSQALLFGPWAEALPNWQYVDIAGKPAVTLDFMVPTEGYEAPWGMAHLVFYYDSARVERAPRTIPALLAWAERNPGRFTFPQPPDHLGTTFLKQVLYELTPDSGVFRRRVNSVEYTTAAARLWRYMDALTPHLWRSGAAYPQNGPRQIQLMADGEIDLAISFNPHEASAAIENFELPDTVRTAVLDAGTISNASFLAIPYNATAKAGALVLANFLLSPEAQLRKLDPVIWGNDTVLSLEKLSGEDRARFERLERGNIVLSPATGRRTIPEPHPSWMNRLEEDWVARFGVLLK